MRAAIDDAKADDGPAETKRTINWLTVGEEVRAALAASVDDWRTAFRPVLQGVVADQAAVWEQVYGTRFDVRNLLAEAWYEEVELRFAQAVSQTTGDALATLLQQAAREGWSLSKATQNIQKVFRQWMAGDLSAGDFAWLEARMPPHRAALIAHTETLHAANAGSHRLFAELGAPRKEWASARDGRVRASHRAADGQVRLLDQPFDVGGAHLLYPHDTSLGAPLSEVIGCRCVLLPAFDE